MVGRTAGFLDDPIDAPIEIVLNDRVGLADFVPVRFVHDAADHKQILFLEALDHCRVARLEQNLVGEKQHEVRTAERLLTAFERMDGSQAIVLDHITNPDALEVVPELVDDLFGPIADNQNDFLHTRTNRVLEAVLQQRLPTEPEHDGIGPGLCAVDRAGSRNGSGRPGTGCQTR